MGERKIFKLSLSFSIHLSWYFAINKMYNIDEDILISWELEVAPLSGSFTIYNVVLYVIIARCIHSSDSLNSKLYNENQIQCLRILFS